MTEIRITYERKINLLGAAKKCLQGTGRRYRTLKNREQLEGYFKNSVER